MKRPLLVAGVCASLVVLALLSWRLTLSPGTPSGRGPLAHEAYVWQRAWTGPVRDAVRTHASAFRQLCCLAAEVTWSNGLPQPAVVSLNYAAIRQTGRPVGLALRVAPFPGPFAADDEAARRLVELGRAVVARARSNGVEVAELQVDFDCPTAKLDGYRLWIEGLARRLAPVPVTITALPSWLRAPAFGRLARSAPRYVLQVHGFERPADVRSALTLCDPGAARRAVSRAGALAVPFRVALPTYGYQVAFDATGRYAGLAAEGPRRAWPAGTRLREVHAQPHELAGLLAGWTARRPAALAGVIWYRLPVATDELNWRWPTLAALVAGRNPRPALRAMAQPGDLGWVEVRLVNDGEVDLHALPAVEARWSGAAPVAGRAEQGFRLVYRGAAAARFEPGESTPRLRVGQSLVVGRLQFPTAGTVFCEVAPF